MTAKEYLLEIRRYKRSVKNLEEQAERLRTELAGLKAITYDTDRVQVTPSNKIEELMPKLIRVEEKYAKAILRYHREILRRSEQINKLGDEELSTVLYLRYIEGKKWEQIASDMSYTERNVFYLHGKALRRFEKVYHFA